MLRNAAGVAYELTYKKVKNINLRVTEKGMVQVSAPKRVPLREIDGFVACRTAWIFAARERLAHNVQNARDSAGLHTDEECLVAFEAVSERIYPLFAEILPQRPEIRVRLMKSRWGVCHTLKKRITLNKMLMDKPTAALEYVVLHEYVHFLHPNHQKGFHDTMARLMPDYKLRRALLK